jgi:hypothetical protein
MFIQMDIPVNRIQLINKSLGLFLSDNMHCIEGFKINSLTFFKNKRGYSSLNNLKSFKTCQVNYPTLANQIKLVSRVIIKYINSVF